MPDKGEHGVITFLKQGDAPFCVRCGNKKKFTVEWWLRVQSDFEVAKDRGEGLIERETRFEPKRMNYILTCRKCGRIIRHEAGEVEK